MKSLIRTQIDVHIDKCVPVQYRRLMMIFLLFSPGLVKNVGPGFTEFINKEVQTEEDALRNIRQKEIDFCKASIAGEQAAQVPPTRSVADPDYVLSCSVVDPDPY
jgi:hypothetical protein